MRAGQRVRAYTLGRRIPGGTIAEVWTALHGLDTEPRFAIKFLTDASRDERERFLKECSIQIELDHPNIVKAWEAFDDPPCLVMTLVPGGSLADELSAQALSPKRVVQISLDILSALEYAHKRSIVHRDVKPQNILIDSEANGKALLTDFGIALVLDEERKTQTGVILGSTQYMSPEQIKSPKTIDYRADIYSFGCVLYEMLTGVPPFKGHPDPYDAHLQKMPEKPSKLSPNAPEAFDRIAMYCLIKDPALRYQSCDELAAKIREAAGAELRDSEGDGAPTSPQETNGPERVRSSGGNDRRPTVPARLPRGRWAGSSPSVRRVGLVGAIAAVLVALVVFLWRAPRSQPVPVIEENVIVSLYGSTSIGDELALALAREFLTVRRGATETGCYGITKIYKSEKVPMQHCWGKIPGSSERQVVEIYSVASEKAFECLAAKICDIGMSSRPFDSKDRANHPGLEDLTKPASEHVIGLDGIAIVVNPLNTIRKLTLSQVKRIFCKTPQPVDTWGELGITGLGQIRRVVRNDGSGTREMFIKQVCQGADLRDVPRGDQLKSEELVNLVASPSASTAIGFVSSTLTGLAVAVPLAPGDGQPALRPDNFSVATEDYVLTRRLYLYNNSAISQDAQSFISFAAGREGQGVAKENHFVSLLAEAVWVPPPSNATPEFIDLTAGARRLSASFRFGSGSAELSPDRLAEDNIERVRSYVELNPGTELLVFGFADNRPPRRGPSNRKLSELRADVIASALEKQIGIPSSSIVVKGFGEEMPVDSNDTPIGRYRNRRVAIWVQQ